MKFLEKQHVVKVLAHAFTSLNRLVLQTKQREFDRYKRKIIETMQFDEERLFSIAKFQPSKHQKKSFQLMASLSATL